MLDIVLAVSVGVLMPLLMVVAHRRANKYNRGLFFIILTVAALLLGAVVEIAVEAGWLAKIGFLSEAVIAAIDRKILDIAALLLLTIGTIQWARAGRSKTPRSNYRSATKALNIPSSDQMASKELVDSVLKSSLNGILLLKAVRNDSRRIIDYQCRMMNEAAEQLLGRSAAFLVDNNIVEHVPWLRAGGLFDAAVSVIETGLPLNQDYRSHNENAWYRIAAVKLGDGLALTFADITDHKRNEELLRIRAHHDALTELPNRAFFTERLQQSINRSQREPDYKFAILFLDFDRFKIINDSLGHEAGDELLIGIGKRLREQLDVQQTTFRVDEGNMPARLGGDEFVVLLDDISDVADAERITAQLLERMSVPHTIADQEVVSTASIGIVTNESGYEKSDDMIRDADTAMYHAKMAGKARYVIFDENMHQEAVDRLNLEQELREAVDGGAFLLHYMPIVSLEAGTIAGIEADIRWPHKKRGLIPLSEFIGPAKELGLVGDIGRWALERACRQLETWHERFPAHPDLFISLDMSKDQLCDPSFADHIHRVLDETGMAPRLLCLEVNESIIIDDPEEVAITMVKLKEMGVRIAMDNFGTGHSSLNCLHQLPFDLLKIDRSIIATEDHRKKAFSAIMHALIDLARNLDIQVIPVGIETEDQLALVRSLECSLGQGPLFSVPVDDKSAEQFLGSDSNFKFAA